MTHGAAEKTVDSMTPSELEEVVTCVRTFVDLQSSKSSDVSTADKASGKPPSGDTPATIAVAYSDIEPPAAKAPAVKANEYDNQSIEIAQKVVKLFRVLHFMAAPLHSILGKHRECVVSVCRSATSA